MTAVIREINIHFTQDKTLITTTSHQYNHDISSLRINVVPDNNGTTIEVINIIYLGKQYGQLVDKEIFRKLMLSIQDRGETLIERITNYLNRLSSDEFDIIIKQYSLYIEDGIIIDGIIAGIASYLTLLWLNEQHITAICPFSFASPYIHDGNSVNKQMFKSLIIPLTALMRTTNNITTQLTAFVTTFINIWEPLFVDGQEIPESNDIRVALDIISQLSQQLHIKTSELKTELKQEIIGEITKGIKEELMVQLTDHIAKEITMKTANQGSMKIKQQKRKINDSDKSGEYAQSINSINNISKYNSYLSLNIDEKSPIKSQKDNFTNIITWRNDNNAPRAVKIQSTGRLDNPLPWRQ